MTKWPYMLCVVCLCTVSPHVCLLGRRQAAHRHIKLISACKASWRSGAVLMPKGGANTNSRHRMWRRQRAQAPITNIVRDVDAILIRGYMAHGELWKNAHGLFGTRIIFLNTNYIFWTRFFLNTNNSNNTNFFEHGFFWTRIPRITRIFFDWKYCEAIKYSFNSSYSCSKKNSLFT